MSALRAELRRVLPVSAALLLAVYLLICLVQLALEASVLVTLASRHGLGPAELLRRWATSSANPELANPFASARALLVIAGAFVFGLWRAGAFHPALARGYRDWLATTPWRHPRPLPLGRVSLGLADALVLALPVVLLWIDQRWSPLWAIVAALAGHQLALLVAFAVTASPFALVPVVGLPALGLLVGEPAGALVLLLALDAAGRAGLASSLRPLPWSPEDDSHRRVRLLQSNLPAAGFLWARMRLEPKRVVGSASAGLALAAYLGWLAFIGLRATGLDREAVVEVAGLASLLTAVGAVARVAHYVQDHAAPISLWGRIRTGRPFVPGYDGIFAAPVAAVLGTTPAILALSAVGLPNALAIAGGFALASAVLILAPPGLRRFALTGDHRIRIRPSALKLDAPVGGGAEPRA